MKILLSTGSYFPRQTSEPGNVLRPINEALRAHEVWAVIADASQYREPTESWRVEPIPRLALTASIARKH